VQSANPHPDWAGNGNNELQYSLLPSPVLPDEAADLAVVLAAQEVPAAPLFFLGREGLRVQEDQVVPKPKDWLAPILGFVATMSAAVPVPEAPTE
jgi:hypothetical protein